MSVTDGSQADASSSSRNASFDLGEDPGPTHPPPAVPLIRQLSAPAGSGEWTPRERSFDQPRRPRVSFLNDVVASSSALPPPPNDIPSHLLYVQPCVDTAPILGWS